MRPPAKRPPSIRYQVELPCTGSPDSSANTFTCWPAASVPTTGACVEGDVRTLASRGDAAPPATRRILTVRQRPVFRGLAVRAAERVQGHVALSGRPPDI